MNTTRLIEAYLDGSLSSAEAQEIKERTKNDHEFAELIRLHKEINESIRDKELNSLRQVLKKISSEIPKSKEEGFFPFRRIIRIAAALLFILLIGTIVTMLFFPRYTGSSTFEKFYSKYEPDVITRSGNSTYKSLENAVFLYQTGEYKECERILAKMVSHDKHNYQALFYLGLAQIELENPNEAISDFLKIPTDWNSPYLIHRNWYLSLCLIRTGNEKQALPLLRDLSAGGKFYADRAGKIIDRIRI
jgi:hypothetical protein